MKKVILILVLFIGFNTIAQKREIKEINPEQFATLSTKRMTLDLDLNESQQTKIYQLNLENANARKMTSDDRFVMQNKMLDHQIAQKKKMKSILTNEQFEKWEKMSKKRMGMYERKRGEKIEVDRMHKMKKENK